MSVLLSEKLSELKIKNQLAVAILNDINKLMKQGGMINELIQ
ncbi:MAG: hypothetical protein PF549_04915 [Patescibacteria group bacterium]|jgi:flagellar basal body-associated protein FliL|nr:hypothetical protein [Patescibacteria group bacterium]